MGSTGHQSNAAEHGLQFFLEMPLIPPRRAFHLLEIHGYRGQETARRSLSLLAYRHVKRLKRIYLDGVPREELPPKSNYLLVGPTGCGKSYLVELLFAHILKLPTVTIDMTGFSETGYIGDDTRTILTRLLLAANGNSSIASAGVVCMDEFDKLATGQNIGRFDGQGTTKDVSGFGVQRELLRMMESSTLQVPTDFNNSTYSTKQAMFTGDVAFIASGAFSGLKLTSLNRDGLYGNASMGFGETTQVAQEQIAVEFEQDEVDDISNFQSYGFLPELMGRFNRIVPLKPLSEETLMEILSANVVERYVSEFAEEGLDLQISTDVLLHIVRQCLERQTGARGLNASLTQYLEDVAFEYFCQKEGRLQLLISRGEVVSKYMP